MEIIKRGQLPGDRPWHGTCYHCKSEIRAKESELDVYSDQREGGEYAVADCPVCEERMTFHRFDERGD